jgi:hypothetical protein
MEIKSVRLRYKSNGQSLNNYKLTLFSGDKLLNKKDRTVRVFINSDGIDYIQSNFTLTFNYNKRYKDYTDDDYINLWIDIQSKSGNNFEIIQNPWEDKLPVYRKYGFDPYYLTNGSEIKVEWLSDSFIVGGTEWSDEDGKELKLKRGTNETKSNINKNVKIYSDNLVFTLDKNLEFNKIINYYVWPGTIDDLDIIKQVISKWNKLINNKIDLCEPNNDYCKFTEFENPIKEQQENNIEEIDIEEIDNETTNSEIVKKQLEVSLPKFQNIKVKEDLNSLVIKVKN